MYPLTGVLESIRKRPQMAPNCDSTILSILLQFRGFGARYSSTLLNLNYNPIDGPEEGFGCGKGRVITSSSARIRL